MTAATSNDHHPHDDDDDLMHRGLGFDLSTVIQRRKALKLFGLGTIGLVGLRQCGCTPGGGSATTTTTGSGASCTVIPEETAGPYPGDGSNGVNVLTQSGIVRSDIRSSFGSASAVAAGVPLTINLTLTDTANDCAPLAGAAVYLWHCDRDGLYSLYSQGVTNENYLRGVQETDGQGQVKFTTIFPACYSGRWPHIHFEVYPSLAKATNGANKIATSQMALPEATCQAVYATSGYEQSLSNMARVSLDTDNVFRDGYDLQMPTVTGDPSRGYQLNFSCAV
jgi:protocatechuate 3,4-dioxygenase beta subunit